MVQGYASQVSSRSCGRCSCESHGEYFENEVAPSPQSSGIPRIMVDIRMTNGIHIQQRNLSYDGLKRLVEKLEALC